MGLLTFALVLCLAVGIHEMGHYLACRAVGVRVTEFSIGMGSRLVGFNTARTAWNLRLLPIGGYIKMNEEQLEAAAPWKKVVIAIAGPLINLLPFVLIGFYFLGAELVGRLLWFLYVDTIKTFTSILLHSIDWFHWIYPVVAEPTAGKVVKSANDGAMGVVGMGSATVHSVARIGAVNTFVLMFSMISIGLALFNLIPLPPLDGGRIVLAGVEQVAGKRIASRVGLVLSLFGALLVIWLIVLLTFKDIAKLF